MAIFRLKMGVNYNNLKDLRDKAKRKIEQRKKRQMEKRTQNNPAQITENAPRDTQKTIPVKNLTEIFEKLSSQENPRKRKHEEEEKS
ncbi:Oidioi.mRNA.OKI2018_I69.chr2.g5909.t1.cds [Oikopleura dioica]|uniref:Oidioi.mRNA.OKI2018_I69.chr2.g5909.t1.cds n=1 Tax=Oikopleura dioica TaxID=34765 RepID=A0ABN7TAU9_OIKDI|nr:Oidioi.mRNA.OKI2018_I69.chr2.g5909.t1.cds [Oikopleura dioica]